MKILFVDDETEFTSILREWFTARGHRVHTATDAKVVPYLFRSHEFDAVTMDLVMPGSNGLSWIDWIRSEFPQTAVVVVSALADLKVAKLAVQEGADDYVCKPVNFSDLEHALYRARSERSLACARQRIDRATHSRISG